MKKALLTLAALAMASSAFAQGQISGLSNFEIANATGGGTYNAPIFMPNGTTLAAAGAFTAGVYAGNTLLGTGDLLIDGFFLIDGSFNIAGAAPGTTTSLTVKVWPVGKTYDTSTTVRGITTFTTQPLGGTNPTPPPPAFFTPGLTGLQSITLVPVPEPTTIALGAIGVGALLLRRRK